MSDFNKLCKFVEDLDPQTYSDVLVNKSAKVLVALAAITKDGYTGVQIFTSFIYAAVMADGKLDKSEFELIRPMLEKAIDGPIEYEDAKAAFKVMKKDAKDDRFIVDLMVDVLGDLSEELKADIIIISMLVCAVDGKISYKEKQWIKQLMA